MFMVEVGTTPICGFDCALLYSIVSGRCCGKSALKTMDMKNKNDEHRYMSLPPFALTGTTLSITGSATISSLAITSSLTGSFNASITGTVSATSANFSSCLSLSDAMTFTGKYKQLSGLPWTTVYNGQNIVPNAIMWTGTAQTASNGTATFYPTSTNAIGGTALFNTILSVETSAWANTSSAIMIPNCAGKSISSDNTTVVINVTVGNTVVLGGSSSAMAGSGVPVMCMIVGY